MRLCAEYLIDGNGTQAAIRAGYAQKSASAQASDVLARPKVKEYLKQLDAEQKARLAITADRVLQEIAKIGLSDPSRYLTVGKNGELQADFSRMTPYDMAAISQVEFEIPKDGPPKRARKPKKGTGNHTSRRGPAGPVAVLGARVSRIKTWDKLGALQLLGRNQGLFSDAPPPAPDPNRDGKRQTLIKVLVQNLEGKAAAVHVQVREGEQGDRPAISGNLTPAARQLIEARKGQKK
jgi:phage terminase small subunit